MTDETPMLCHDSKFLTVGAVSSVFASLDDQSNPSIVTVTVLEMTTNIDQSVSITVILELIPLDFQLIIFNVDH